MGWLAGLLLAGNAWRDLRLREISLWWTGLWGAVGIAAGLWSGREPAELLAGLLPGAISLLCSLLTQESVGLGDGLVLLALGTLLPCTVVWGIVWRAGWLCAGAALLLRLLGKEKEDHSLPYLPFLLLGYLAEMGRWL